MAQLNLRDVSDETYERLRLAAYAEHSTVPQVARAWLDQFRPPKVWPPMDGAQAAVLAEIRQEAGGQR